MPIIQCPKIESPITKFSCDVLRSASNMRYQDAADGKWKPVQPEKWEEWTVLAETKEGAKKIAEYHFYNSDSSNIIIKDHGTSNRQTNTPRHH